MKATSLDKAIRNSNYYSAENSVWDIMANSIESSLRHFMRNAMYNSLTGAMNDVWPQVWNFMRRKIK